MKKILLSLGTIAAVAVPVTSTLACSSEKTISKYTEVKIDGLRLADHQSNPFVITSTKGKVLISGKQVTKDEDGNVTSSAKRTYLIPEKFVDITPPVKRVIDEKGDVKVQDAEAKYTLSKLGKENKILSSIETPTIIGEIPKDNVLLIERKDKLKKDENLFEKVSIKNLDDFKLFMKKISKHPVATRDFSKNAVEYLANSKLAIAEKVKFNRAVIERSDLILTSDPVSILEQFVDKNLVKFFNSVKVK